MLNLWTLYTHSALSNCTSAMAARGEVLLVSEQRSLDGVDEV
jgi:hypothetical protein